MYLHLGGDTVVPVKEIIGIFDLEITTAATDTRDFLRSHAAAGILENNAGEMPKSFILTRSGKSSRIYTSPISVTTLYKRNLIGKVQENV
ncbi:MAG TPA: DUF370 domain-containing protein [Clostridiales bacterium]|nr:DUF370 domain-containing protein [Clostridiales bacterium]